MGRQRTCRHVEHGREHLTCYLVHVGNHEQQPLRGGECRGQSACLQRTVHGSSRPGLALHLGDLDGLAPKVLLAVSSPLVHVLRHCGGRRDRVDCGMLAEQVCYVGSSLVAVTSDEFLFCSHYMSLYLIVDVCMSCCRRTPAQDVAAPVRERARKPCSFPQQKYNILSDFGNFAALTLQKNLPR